MAKAVGQTREAVAHDHGRPVPEFCDLQRRAAGELNSARRHVSDRDTVQDVSRSDMDEELSPTARNAGVDHAVAAARRVMNALLHAGNSSPAEMDEVATKLNDVADYLESHAPDIKERMVDMWSGEGISRH